jgi:hypothetical protein
MFKWKFIYKTTQHHTNILRKRQVGTYVYDSFDHAVAGYATIALEA